MEDFKQYLSNDADDREHEAAEQVRKGLGGLRLEAKVSAVAAERRILLRRRLWWQAMSAVALIVITGIGYWLFLKKTTSVEPVNTGQPIQIKPSDQPAQAPAPIPQIQAPIADRPKTPRERIEQPMIRGGGAELDSATNRLINILLKMTETNNSSTDFSYNQQQHNRMGHWGDAVRALRGHKPAYAKKSIFLLEKDDPREARWLLGIALLEEGNTDEAKKVFEEISKDSEAYRGKEAGLVVEALK
jgi:hypothetical protein